MALKRCLGLFEMSMYGVGIILGAGIYALIGKAAGIAGNALWLSFVFAALIASFTGLSYAELTSLFPKAAAEYVYVERAFKKRWLSFVVGWTTIFTGIVSSATVALGFGGYLSSLIPFNPIAYAILLIVFLSFLNYLGIKESSRANIIFTLIEASGLILIILLALPYLGSVNYLEMPSGFSGVFTAAALIFFAYIGFEDLANMAEEARNPRKTVPLAIIISILITTLLYILVSLSVVSVVDWKSLGDSHAPLAEVATKAGGPGYILSIIALFATANTVLIMLIVTSRMLYGMANEGALFSFLAKTGKRKTPWLSILVTMLFVILFVSLGDIRTVAELTNFGVLFTFICVNASLIYLRFKLPATKRFKLPLNIGKFPILPALGIIFSLFLIMHFQFFVLIGGTLFLIFGIFLYVLIEKLKTKFT